MDAVVETKERKAKFAKISFVFSEIGKVSANSIVCPENQLFSSNTSIEQESIKSSVGNDVFLRAGHVARDYIDESRRAGYVETKALPFAFARKIDIDENENGVKQVVFVNTQGNEDPSDSVKKCVISALREADLDTGVKIVALPLFGFEAGDSRSLLDSVKASVSGINEFMDLRPATNIGEVKIVINADDTQQNRDFIESISKEAENI